MSHLNVFECLVTGILFYYLTSLISIIGAIAGYELVQIPHNNSSAVKGDLLSRFANWDGQWYQRIATDGYKSEGGIDRGLAFFPGYPLLGGGVWRVTGLRPELALLLVSHSALIGVFVLAVAYVRRRYPVSPSDTLPGFVLLALGLTPATFFFRMAYTESLFVLLLVLALYGMERRWPLLLIAVIVGGASGVRAVGVALVPGFLLHIWERAPQRWVAFQAALLTPLACWGIAAYMLFQFLYFGHPMLFFKAEATFNQHRGDGVGTKLLSDLTLATAWHVFDPSSRHYWGRGDTVDNPLFSLSFANPLYFASALLLVALGIRKRWLNRIETTTAFLLLLIPYFTKGYDISMAGTARFVSVIFPLYLVLGNILARMPAPLATGFLALGAFFLGLYSALFAAWYRFI